MSPINNYNSETIIIMPGGGLMQLVAYGSQDVYFFQNTVNIVTEEISPRWWGERDKEKVVEIKLVDKLKTDKVCEDDCIICMENMKDTDLCECKECQILIHYKCLKTWINTKNTCPHCRASFVCRESFVCKTT